MSKNQDIIGLVKEWKKSACGGTPLMDCNRCELIKEHFPAIAQALLMAEDALEKIAVPDTEGKARQEFARKTLDHIHSLKY